LNRFTATRLAVGWGINDSFFCQIAIKKTVYRFVCSNTARMVKTVHSQFTKKHIGTMYPTANLAGEGAIIISGLAYGNKLLQKAATRLLQPRPEAVSNLLRMAREL
jgi:hypothetical protein